MSVWRLQHVSERKGNIVYLKGQVIVKTIFIKYIFFKLKLVYQFVGKCNWRHRLKKHIYFIFEMEFSMFVHPDISILFRE